jgi:hypothetical protein
MEEWDDGCELTERGGCKAACDAMIAAIAQPGRVSGAGSNATCESESTDTYATHQEFGAVNELAIHARCDNPFGEQVIEEVFLFPSQDVDGEVPCGIWLSRDTLGYLYNRCDAAEGTLAVVEVDGRRMYSGTCSCNGESITVEAPYRFFGWGVR